MIDIEDTIAEFRVNMRLSEDDNQLMIEIRMGDGWYPQLVDTFENQRILGEYLSDYLGAKLAGELLERHDVPRDWPVWKLNRKG